MPKTRQGRRLAGLAVCLVLGLCLLGVRLVDLQVIRHEELAVKARQNIDRNYVREPHRGDIRDINGNLLATSVEVRRIVADPTLIGGRYPQMARVLAPLLKVPVARLEEQLKPHTIDRADGTSVPDQYEVLKKKVPVEDWEAIQEFLETQTFGFDVSGKLGKSDSLKLRNLRAHAIYAEQEQMRIYPNKTLAAHVIGFVGDGEHMGEMVGKDGIELVLNTNLTGVQGWRETERDRRGRELVQYRLQDVEPRDGLNAVLTIDSVIQEIVEAELASAFEEHSPQSVSAVVVRPRTGEILALATVPNFNPNRPGDAPASARRNRVIADVFEPGSTFKVVVVSGALSQGVVQLEEVFDCENGHFVYGGKTLRDDHPHGLLPVLKIVQKSSNIGAAKIGLRLGEDRLYRLIQDYGFGERTGIPLPGEVAGIVHPPDKWDKLTITRIPMGHAIATTPLQMAMAMSAIANNGQLMHPMLVDRLEDSDGAVVKQYYPQKIKDVITPNAARKMVVALESVVSPEGTAPKAMLDHYTVAGKTGTAQKAGRGGYLPGKYYSSFIGFFPADNPELCIAVTMDEPHHGYYGGQTAAPTFNRIAEQAASYLKIPPDLDPADGPVSKVDSRGIPGVEGGDLIGSN